LFLWHCFRSLMN